jgi:DNA-binding MarR family transcriptional regulator
MYEKHLSEAGLTSAQFSILGYLSQDEEVTMQRLATALVMDRTTLLRAMQPLQRDDLIRSRQGSADPRQLVFSLTPAGERKLNKAVPLWQKAQEEFETEIGSRHAAQIRRALLELARPNGRPG